MFNVINLTRNLTRRGWTSRR